MPFAELGSFSFYFPITHHYKWQGTNGLYNQPLNASSVVEGIEAFLGQCTFFYIRDLVPVCVHFCVSGVECMLLVGVSVFGAQGNT